MWVRNHYELLFFVGVVYLLLSFSLFIFAIVF